MTTSLYLAVSALALASLSAPVAAQHAGHSGMTTPAPPPAAKKQPAKKPPARKATAIKRASTAKAAPKPAPDPGPDATATPTNTPSAATPDAQPPIDHSAMGHSPAAPLPTDHAAATETYHSGHRASTGALGLYPMTREASGTAWQPDNSAHMGVMVTSGAWTLMGHGVLNLVFDSQGGRRGKDKIFVPGMLMGMARRPIGNGTLQFKAMVSPDPLMGRSGYPLLLASGETANGVDRLIDRQHPHDLFMELSASVSQRLGANGSLFVYAGLPGEPAFGPPAFMHREAILDSPEAPITHHWLDSTHISFGVVTAGVTLGDVRVEASRFNGREPDERRYNIETGRLDSTALRLSWNPTPALSLQGSWGDFTDPEQLEPGEDQTRWSASALYARDIAPGWKLAGTLAWGRKQGHGHADDAVALEASLKHRRWTLFGRGEITENRELVEVEDGPAYRVGKASVGIVRDVPVADHFAIGVGGLVALNFVPDALAPRYGGSNPIGAMGFVRLKVE